MRFSCSSFAISVALATLSGPSFATDVFGYTDSSGVTHYTNVPDSSRYRLVLRNADDFKFKSENRYLLHGTQLPEINTKSSPYAQAIFKEARANQLDPFLVDALISVESNHNPNARSSTGAAGLMQLMPDTAKRYGVVDPYHAESNIRGGTRYLRDLMVMFDGDISLVLAAYNAGENSVLRHGKTIPPYPETRDYVPRVMRKYAALKNVQPTGLPLQASR